MCDNNYTEEENGFSPITPEEGTICVNGCGQASFTYDGESYCEDCYNTDILRQ